MKSKNCCPQCGCELSANAPGGLCPGCLLQAGLKTNSFPSHADAMGEGDRFATPAAEELAPRFPDLEIIECIGRGGMGMVYKARQKHLDRFVALKILAPQVARDGAFAERFSREARAMAMLNHPNIVTVYDFGQTASAAPSESAGMVEGPLYYFLMEYVEGATLRQLLDAGRLAPREALSIVPQICEALQFAHDKGIVHRDIKPENILLDRAGRVKIADFGLAKLVGAATSDLSLTGTGQVMGTPHYMAPEQMQHPQEVDHRADIYSLGVVFYQMLTGELPLGRFVPPSKKVEIDVRLDEVVLKTLENEPALRFQHASEVKSRVETICATPTIVAPPSRAITAAPDSRLSYTAVAGAAWAPLFLFVLLSLVAVRVSVATDQAPPGPAWWQMILLFTLLPLGLTAPLGTTTLGVVALSQIRRSAGRIYGLGLALFDALLYPLVVLDCLIGWMWFAAARMFIDFHANPAMQVTPQVQPAFFTRLANVVDRNWPAVPLILTFTTALAVDFCIVRAAWRAVNTQPSSSEATKPASSEKTHPARRAWVLVIAAAVISLVCAMMWGTWFPNTSSQSPRVALEQRLEHEIRLRLEEHSNRFDGLSVVFAPDGMSAKVTIANLQEMRGVAGSNEWVPVEGVLSAHYVGSGRMEICGDGQLGGVRFEVFVGDFLREWPVSPLPNSSKQVEPKKAGSDQVLIEDLALEMLVAIREKDDAALKAVAVEQPKAWPDALPHFAVELRERFMQIHDKPFRMYPTESLVEGDLAVVKCQTAEKQGMFLVLFFRKTESGWRNWMMRNATPEAALEKFLKEKPPAAETPHEKTDPPPAEEKPAEGPAPDESPDKPVEEPLKLTPTQAKFEFRIVPNPVGSSQTPVYPALVGQTAEGFAKAAIEQLAKEGPASVPTSDYALCWVEMAEGVALPDALVGSYQDKKFALLCDEDSHVLRLPAKDADAGRVDEVAIAKDSLGNPIIQLRLDVRAGEQFAALTKANLGNSLAMIVDGRVLSAPRIQSEISRDVVITGRFTEGEMETLIKTMQGNSEASQPTADKP